MSTELIEINATALRRILSQQEISRFDLAERLEISTKTIQRWLNQTVRRVKPETLDRLCEVLGANAQELKQDSPALKLAPTDKAVTEICSDRTFEQIRLADDWNRYLDMLKAIHTDALSSEQRLVVFRNIGICSFYLAKFQASKLYLKKAQQLADLLQIDDHKADIGNWSARLEEATGNFDLAEEYLRKNELFLPNLKRMSVVAEYSYVRARMHLHQWQNEEAEMQFRKGLLTSFRHRTKPHPLLIAWMYMHLAQLYIRLKDYTQARICCQRLIKSAEKSAWSRGVMLAHYYLGVVEQFAHGPSEVTRRHFGKARSMHRSAFVDRYCPLLQQAEFLYFILNKRYQDARANLAHRLFKVRKAEFYLASTTLDGLLLSKLNPEAHGIRKSAVVKAQEYYRARRQNRPLELIQKLEERKQITPQEISEFYYF